MLALHSAPGHEGLKVPARGVGAIVYADEAYPDAVFSEIVRSCRARGLSLAGVLQHRAFEDIERRCDVILENLATAHCIPLFESRGKEARGCRLDTSALARVTAEIEKSLDHDPNLLVLNKFGKVEASGGGLRDLIATALDRAIPVVIGVPARNLDAWREFAGEFALEFSPGAAGLRQWLSDVAGRRKARITRNEMTLTSG